jgi:hypothetical protein
LPWVGLALVAIAAAVAMMPAKEQKRPEGRTEQRVKEGPRIVSTKAISATETVRVLVIPHPLGEFFDTACVIYTNREFGSATMSCPNIDPSNLKDSVREQDRQR